MIIGKLLKVKNNSIDISEIPFINYLNKNISLTILRHEDVNGKGYGAMCYPFGRSVYSIWTETRLALSHYIKLQDNEEIKKLIDSEKLPKIKCNCKQSENQEQYFKLHYFEEDKDIKEVDKIETPVLICSYCCEEWGRLPDEVVEVYRISHGMKDRKNEIIIPMTSDIEEELVWVMFDDSEIDWERTGKIRIE